MSLFKALAKLLSSRAKYQTQRRTKTSNSKRGKETIGERKSSKSVNRAPFHLANEVSEFEKMTVSDIVKKVQNHDDIKRLERAQEAVENAMMEDLPQSEINRLERVRDKFENAWEKAFDKTIAYYLDPESIGWDDPVELISIAGHDVSIEKFNQLKKEFPDWKNAFSPVTFNDEGEYNSLPKEVVRICIKLQNLRNEGGDVFLEQADKIIAENKEFVEFIKDKNSGASARCLLQDELCKLPSIGVERAHLLFERGVRSLDDVFEGRWDDVDVPGIGPKTREKINHWIAEEQKRRKIQS